MARLQLCDYHNMVAILEKSEHNIDFHSIVDFVEASPLREILSFRMRKESGEGSGTPTEPHHTPSHEALPTSHTTYSSPTLPLSSALPPVADEPASPLRDVSQGEAFPTDSGFIADQDRVNIAKSSTLPHDPAPRVTSPAAVEGTQEVEINRLKARVKLLEDREGVAAERFGDDAPIKGRNLDEGEAAAKRVSDDSKEMATVLTSMDAATVLAGGVAEVPTGNESIQYTRRKGKETMVESKAPKKQKVQEHIDAQVARELEEKMAREDQRKSEQIARDAEIAQIHAEEELQIMIDTLDRSNETVAKYLQEYQQFASELPLERRIELISDLIKYQDNYAKIYKYQSQQRKHLTKKQQREFYTAVLRNQARWKAKYFKGMKLEEIKENFDPVWKQLHDFVSIGSKEEGERFKMKGTRFKQESIKKLKTSEEVLEEVKSLDEVPKEKVKEMMQLVPIKEVYVESFHVKHPIIDWKVHTKGKRRYWKITRLYEPDEDDQLWTHTQNLMHALVEWKLYDSCGVHHVTARNKEIFMLVEKDYPLRKGLAIVMISYKLQVENYSRMENDLILMIFKIASTPKQQVIDFPLAEEVPTASKESSHCQKKKDATAKRIALLGELDRVMDIQMARQLEEEMEREDQRMSEQIARDVEVARIHVEEELHSMIDGLDMRNETVAKYLQEYQQFASELPLVRRIELISNLVRYQETYAKVHKFQTQQRKPWSKKQKRDYYMAVIRSNLGWKVKDFRGMSFEEIEAKFTTVWKQLEDFIHMGSKEEAERLKRKGLSLEQESMKKLKTSEEVTKEAKSPDEVPEEKVKEMMQLVPVEEVEDLNQLWALVKESLSNKKPTSDIEMELWERIVGSKMHKAFTLSVIEFPLAEEVPTASEESSHCQKKRDATAKRIALLGKCLMITPRF
nr:hypothetical protein [Tanacetum cinerariifolium]